MASSREQAVEEPRSLPQDRQDELAPVVMMLAGMIKEPFELTPEDDAAIEMSGRQARRGEFAADEEMQAIRSKHGL